MKSFLFAGIGLLALSMASYAGVQATYYVSPSGSGSTCSESQPGSLSSVRDKIRTVNGSMTGDIVVNLKGGTYELSSAWALDQSDDGSNGYTIIYQAYNDERPVISGGKAVTGWTVHDAAKKIWKATAPSGISNRQLYVNGRRAVRAHWGPRLKQWEVGLEFPSLDGWSKTSTGYTLSDVTMQSWGNPSDIEFRYTGGTSTAGWSDKRIPVASITGTATQTTITMKASAFDLVKNAGWSYVVSNPTDIENAYELLDAPGEWYLNRTTNSVYYIPRAGENMSTATVIAPVLETLLSASGSAGDKIKNIQFKGITFAHATIDASAIPSWFTDLQANHLGSGGTIAIPGNVILSSADRCKFERCMFIHLGSTGLEIKNGATNNIVLGSVFTDISGNCIQIGNNSASNPATNLCDTSDTVMNCYIHDAPSEFLGGCGIQAGYVANLVLSHNEICNTPYSAISVGWGWGRTSYAQNNEFCFNNLHHYMRVMSDGGGIYTLSEQGGSANTRWHDNWFHDQLANNQGVHSMALYTDEGSASMQLTSNVISSLATDVNTSSNGGDPSDSLNISFWYQNNSTVFSVANVTGNYTQSPNQYKASTMPTGNTLVSGQNWPQAAINIMNNAGIQSAYLNIKNMSDASSIGSPVPNLADLIAYYSFDATSGTTLTDGSSYNHNGVVSGTWSAGQKNNAFSGFAAIAPKAELMPQDSFTVACWLNFSATNYDWTREYPYVILEQPGRFKLTPAISRYNSHQDPFKFQLTFYPYNSTVPISMFFPWASGTNAWHHFTMVYNANMGVSVYLDGQLIKTQWDDGRSVYTNPLSTPINPSMLAPAGASALSYTGNPFYMLIGGNYLASGKVKVDEFYMYRRVLSISEIQSVMNGSMSPVLHPLKKASGKSAVSVSVFNARGMHMGAFNGKQLTALRTMKFVPGVYIAKIRSNGLETVKKQVVTNENVRFSVGGF